VDCAVFVSGSLASRGRGSPGCATQGDTFEELPTNIHEAAEGCLAVELKKSGLTENDL
jgi:hypothetical protein